MSPSDSGIEPTIATSFKTWFTRNGGAFNTNAVFNRVTSGLSVLAQVDIPAGVTIVKCPFHLAITVESSQRALRRYLPLDNLISSKKWSERQWISVYICFHWIVQDLDSSELAHYAFIQTLPSPQQLRTPLHFTPSELKMFEGTNLYHATLDRGREWREEWKTCRDTIAEVNSEWGAKLSWESYLTAATYVSSRAFPSSILSPNPSLQSSPTTKPVLLPGIDALNHARAKPVSWVVSYPETSNTEISSATISLVLHTPTPQGGELLNNYGPKPNSEFILGYGFSLPNNVDDTIVLKVGGIDGKRWEVGRSAQGIDGLWSEILALIKGDSDSPSTYEDCLDAAGALSEMVQTLLDRLPDEKNHRNDVRPEVTLMWRDYVEGQRDILESVKAFAQEKERRAIEAARVEGIEIVLDD